MEITGFKNILYIGQLIAVEKEDQNINVIIRIASLKIQCQYKLIGAGIRKMLNFNEAQFEDLRNAVYKE